MVEVIKINMEDMVMLMGIKVKVIKMIILMKEVLKKDYKDKMIYLCLRRWSYLVFLRIRILRSLLFLNKRKLLLLRVIGFIDGDLNLIQNLSCISFPMRVRRTSWVFLAVKKNS